MLQFACGHPSHQIATSAKPVQALLHYKRYCFSFVRQMCHNHQRRKLRVLQLLTVSQIVYRTLAYEVYRYIKQK